jgi:trimethylamine--corrinoid protein Co-methyltransferase
MKFNGQILNEEEQNRIHLNSLRILEEVGVRYYGDIAPDVLRKNGIHIDLDERIARVPEEMVEHCLQSTPRSFVLGARNPQYNYPLPSPISRYCIDGTAAFTIDFETGERRYGTCKDIEDSLRVFQQMDMGIMAWAPTCASDAPAGSRALHEFFTMLKYCSKHGEHELHRREQVPYLIQGLKAILGSEEAIKSRGICSLIYCPVAPLTHDGEMLDAYLELGEYDLPVMIMPMPVPGTTGPASLFSNIILANAEALSTIVILQLANPGRPLIYSSATGSVDFRNGGYLAGTPEMGLQSAALTVMGRYYSLPTGSAGCSSDAKQPGPEAVIEKIITALPALLVDSDIIIGTGEIEGDQALILEQLVVDNEIGHLLQRLVEGVDASPEQDLFEDILKVGPGGHFLKARSTRLAARSKEFYTPQMIDRQFFDAWLSLGKPSMYANARRKVKEILAGPVVDALPEEVVGELDEILHRADREIL